MAIKNNNDLNVSAGFSVDTSGLVQLKDYLKRASSFMTAAATTMKKAFNSLDSAFKNVDPAGTKLTDVSIRDLGANYTDISVEASRATDSLMSSNNRIISSNRKVARSFELIDYAAVSVFRRILRTSTRIYKSLALAGSNMTETNSRFNYLLGDLADEAERYAEAISNAYAITETEAKAAITKIFQMAKNAGISSSAALKMAKDLTVVGAELSSVWDVSTEQSVEALISALQGLPKAAKNVGVFTNITEYKELLKEAGVEVEGTLTRQQQITGVFLKTLKDAGFAIGDFARTQSSVANQLRLVNSAFTTIKENVGSAINSVLSPLLSGIINPLLKTMVRITNVLNSMPEPLKVIIGLFATLTISIPIVVSLFILLTRVKQIYKKQVYSLYRGLLAQNGAMATTVKLIRKQLIPGFINTAKVVLPLVIFVGTLVSLISRLSEAQEENKKATEESTKATKDSAKALAGYDDVNVLNFNTSTGFDAENWKIIQEQLGLTTTTIEEVGNDMLWLYGIMAVGSGAYTVFAIIKNWTHIKNIFLSLPKIISTLGGSFIKLIKGITNMSASGWGATAAFSGLIAAMILLYDIFNRDWNNVGNQIVAMIGAIVMAIGSLIAAIGFLKHNYVQAAIGLGIAAGGGIAAVGAYFVDDAQTIPAAATGGTTIGPTKALVGEGRYREAIIPLGNSSEFSSMKNDITNAVVAGLVSAGGSNGNVNITINVDEDYIYKAYNRQKALRGEA